MAAITELITQSGQVVYCTIHDSAARVANGVSTEVYNGSNWSTYVNTLSEQGQTGYYSGTFPSYLTAGKFTIVFYQQPGGSATLGDPVIGSSSLYFDGTIEEQGIGKVLIAYLLDQLVKNTTGGTPPTIGSFFDRIMNKDAGQTFSQGTASLQAIQSGSTAGPTAIQIANQVWDTVLPGAHTVASSGSMLIQALVNMLPTTGPLSNFNPASQTVNLGSSQTGVTIGTVNAIGSTGLTSILTQIRTALSTDTMTELVSVPSATPTIYQALMISYMALRNEHTTTSSQEKIKNNAGTVIGTAAVSDNGTTYTKGQFS